MSSLARGSSRPHSVSNAALYRGVREFTERFTGTPWPPVQFVGAMIVTFGSDPRKAERRNLKVPVPTRRSVQARIADFWSFWASMRAAAPRPGAQRPCRRPSSRVGFTLITMSTSGTATPKATRLVRLPFAKPLTSASGRTGAMARLTVRAISATVASASGDGAMRRSSSCTSSSQPWALKVGATTGIALGLRTSCLGVSETSLVDHVLRAIAASTAWLLY
mmetsp:Transcript_143537/g.400107  ORF Transcript_143537/g.400107 Transcript_143537/m.400107 type:complete len:221 (-) Transcript_143537:416-1078(-)